MSETPVQYWNYVPETLCLYEYNRQTSGNLKTRKGDMNQQEFDALSKDLRAIAKSIPLRWGSVQNDRHDHLLNMFSLHTYTDLEASISEFDEDVQLYFKRRWYLWKCAQCDEYLFYKNTNVTKNPNPKDQTYDVCFDGKFYFDIKGTVIPKSMRTQAVEDIICSPQEIVNFYYDRQSQGVRKSFQNRIFIVHHSDIDPDREFYLRCAWKTKEQIFRYVAEHISEIDFVQYKNLCESIVIFIIEKENGKIEWKIAGLNQYQPSPFHYRSK